MTNQALHVLKKYSDTISFVHPKAMLFILFWVGKMCW